jgi:hypothetical protein
MNRLSLSFDAASKLKIVFDRFKVENVSNEDTFVAQYRNTEFSIDNDNTLVLDSNSDNLSLVMSDISKVTEHKKYSCVYVVETTDKDNPNNLCILALFLDEKNYSLIDEEELSNINLSNNNSIIKYGRILSKNLPYKFSFVNKLDWASLNINKFSTCKLKSLAVNHCILDLVRNIGHKIPVIIESFCSIDTYIKSLEVTTQKYIDVVMVPSSEESIGLKWAKIFARYVLLVKKAKDKKKE